MNTQHDEHATPVIFRKFKTGEVIALFPQEPGTRDPYTCMNYMRTGQHGHGSADLGDTVPAAPDECVALFKELTGLGYRLSVRFRFTQRDLEARRKALVRP